MSPITFGNVKKVQMPPQFSRRKAELPLQLFITIISSSFSVSSFFWQFRQVSGKRAGRVAYRAFDGTVVSKPKIAEVRDGSIRLKLSGSRYSLESFAENGPAAIRWIVRSQTSQVILLATKDCRCEVQ